MFYSHQLLARKAPLGQIWMAAMPHVKINRKRLDKLDIIKICEEILNPSVPMAVRLSRILMGGVVIVYERKAKLPYDDVCRLLIEVIEAWRMKPATDPTVLPKGKAQDKYEAVTLPGNTMDMGVEQPMLFSEADTSRFPGMDLHEQYINVNLDDDDFSCTEHHHQADAVNITLVDNFESLLAETDVFNRFERFDIADDDTTVNITPDEHPQVPTILLPSPPRQEDPPQQEQYYAAPSPIQVEPQQGVINNKGNLIGVNFNWNIYAFGDEDGNVCVSDVKVLNPAIGMWIKNQPMLAKCFALVGVELYGAIYAGFNGIPYLRINLLHQMKCKNDGMGEKSYPVQFFVRQLHRTTSVQISLDDNVDTLKESIEVKTRMRLDDQYFSYGNHVLESKYPLASYGISRDSTVDLRPRLRGGQQTLRAFFRGHKKEMMDEANLPDGNRYPFMTLVGCEVLGSWVHCFTKSYESGMSWNGCFSLDSFKVVNCRVQISQEPTSQRNSNSMRKDLTKLVDMIRNVFVINSRHPPYLKNLMQKLIRLSWPDDKLFIETHVSFMTCYDRLFLLIKLKRKYDGLQPNLKVEFNKAIEKAQLPCSWYTTIKTVVVFKEVFQKAQNENRTYKPKKTSCLQFLRSYGLHAPSYTWDDKLLLRLSNCDDDVAVELMIPKHMGDFVPEIIEKVIEEHIDIAAELLTCVRGIVN